MLWRPLRDALPADSADTTESPRHDELTAQITRALGGCVAALATGPTGLAAALWTREAYPPWYRLLIWSGALRAMTPASVRVWGDPCWSADGCLAAAAFDGVRRGIVAVNPGTGATRWWCRPADASYRLLTLGPGGGDAVAVRGDRDGSAWLVRARPHCADHRMRQLRPADATGVEVVTWAHGQFALEGLLARPPGPGPHPVVVFLHGGPVGALACGEHPDLSAWVSSGLAVFVPGFRGSGIAGERAMWQAFRRRGLPARDPEAGDVLAGVNMLVARGVADPDALTLLGHSYGGYLAGRLLARDHRFRAAALCEAVADLRLLDAASQQMHARWLGGDARHQPGRWAAASPAQQARKIRTPLLLIYADGGDLAAQAESWRSGLAAAGVEHRLITVDDANHMFSSSQAQRRLHQEVTAWFLPRRGGKISCRKGAKLPERSGTFADDPFGDRHPTSHERLSGQPWDASYHEGPAPWDIGQPQPAVVRLASEGGFAGEVLDAGCGTGENALHLALLGLPVLGVDVAHTALAIARQKAADSGIEVQFAAADALQLERLGRSFETVLDCGLFHSFDADERPGYVASLASVTEHGGTLYVLCFSDDGPGTGPHPVSRGELRAAFTPGSGWNVATIEPDRLQTRYHDDNGAPAWLATINRI